MEQMSKQDKEIQRSANEAVPYSPRPSTPVLKENTDKYKIIYSLIDQTFGIPSNYVKCKMYDYEGRSDVLVNFWVPDPNQCELDLIRKSIILSYRYEQGKVERT